MGYKIYTNRNETCRHWDTVQNAIYTKSKEYLTNTRRVLSRLISLGYKTCHHTNSLEATVCANDCKEMEKLSFAKNCTENGGLFKCCIRRDKIGCNECRFCCTLPMCTYSPGTHDSTVFDIKQRLELKDQKNKGMFKYLISIFFSKLLDCLGLVSGRSYVA